MGTVYDSPIEALRKNWLKLSLSTLVVMAVGAFVASKAAINPQLVWQAMQSMGWGAILLAFLGNFLQILFLILRYQVLIPREIHPGFRRVVYAIGLGQTVNTFFPARAGDVLKCFLFSKAKPQRLTLLSSAGVLLADRIVDMSALIFMAVAWGSYRHPSIQERLATLTMTSALVTAFVLLGIAVAVVFLLRRARRISRWSTEFRRGTLCLTRPKWLALGFVMGALCWSGEALSIIALSHTQGLNLSFANAVFVIVALNLAIAVPVSFANVGPFEAAIALALTTFGLDSSPAFAVATVHHGIQLAALLLWSALALLARRSETASLRRRRRSPENP